MKRMFVLAALGIAFVFASVTYVSAGSFRNYNLQGEYSLVGYRACVFAEGGFTNDENIILNSDGVVRVGPIRGVLQLKRDGTGSYNGEIVQIIQGNLSTGERPLSIISNAICDVNHQRFPDGTVEIRLIGCNGDVEAGNGRGGSFLNTTDVVFSGEVSALANILLLSDLEPNVERGEFTNYMGDTSETPPHICTRSSTAIRRW